MNRWLLLPLAASATLLCLRCDNVTCKTVTAGVGTLCLPDKVAVDSEVRIEIRELCGLNCARTPICSATLVSGVIVLDVHEEQCNDITAGFCGPNPCLQRIVPCKLPPLPQGDYTLRGSGLADELVQVRPGGLNGCTIPVFRSDGGTPDGGTDGGSDGGI